MTPATKGAIVLAAIGGLLTILKIVIQARAARQATADKVLADAEVARLRKEAEERSARHLREAEEREEEREERKAEREQKEKLFQELQTSNEKTLQFMRDQLKAQQESGAKRYEIIERGNANIATLAAACAVQGQELRVMVDRIAKLEGGAGCRALGGRPA